MSRRVSQSFTLSFAELKFTLSILCGTLRFISEPLRENKNNFLVSPLLITNTLLDFSPKYNTFRSGLNNESAILIEG